MELVHRLRARVILTLAATAPIFAALFGVLAWAQPAQAVTTVPLLINFQGRLTDNNGNVLSDGSYNVKFRIFDASSSGTNRWEGDRVYGASDHRVSVQNGLFNIQFGDTSQGDPALSPSLFNTQTYANLYLEVELPTPASATCASNGCAVWTEGAMTPRQPFAASPYAFNSDTLDGLDSSAFGQLTAANAFTGANTFTPGSGVGITVQAAAATDSLDVKDSGGSVKAYFDANGNLNLARTLQATASNSIDLGASGATFRTGYFGTSVVTPALNATTVGSTVTTNAGTLQRTASGTFTLDLADSGNTTLAVQNSGAGVANLTVDGQFSVGSFASATSTPVCSNSGTLATCNSNPAGVTLQQAYAASNTISTTGNDVGFTLNSSQSFTVATATGATGFVSITRADGSGTSDPAQLLLVKNLDVDRALPIGIKIDAANSNGKVTTAIDASSTNITNALSVGANTITGTTGAITYTNFNLNASGDITSAFTQLDGSSTTSGTGNSKTVMTLNSVANFDVGNYIRLQNGTACDGTATTCYAKITAVAGSPTNQLTITPALTWANAKTVDEWHLPEIGGTDTAQTQTNRYGRGYFISGVATGNGTTYYNEDGIASSLTTFNLLSGADSSVTDLELGKTGTTVNVPGALTVNSQSVVNASGQINGAQLQAASVANGALANSSITLSGTGLTVGGASSNSVALGASLALATAYGSSANTAVQGNVTVTCPAGSGNLTGGGTSITLGSGGTCIALDTIPNPTFSGLLTASKSGANALLVSGTPLAGSGGATSSLVQIGNTAIASGNNTATTGGTWLGLNAASSGAGSTADFINFQNNGTYKFKVTSNGLADAVGGLSVNGTSVINSSGVVAGASQTYGSSANTAVQGNTQLICPTGTGNISSSTGGNTITLGSGGTCNSLNTINNPSFSTSVTSPSFTGAGAVTVSSGGSSDLTLDSASNIIQIAASDTTLQHIAAGTYTLDVKDAANTTFALANSGAGVANFTADGSVTGTTLGASTGTVQTAGTDRLTNAGALTNITGYSQSSGNFAQSGSGTFGTGTGAVSLNGATTVKTASSNAFQVQDAGSNQLFNLDTSLMNLAVNTDAFTVVNLLAPTSPLVSAGANTGGTLLGSAATTYYYKITAVNSVGETIGSSETSINGQSFTQLTAPGALTATQGGVGGNMTANSNYTYKVTFVTAEGETTGGTASATCSTTSNKLQCVLSAVPTGPTGTTARKIYRSIGAGSYLLDSGLTATFNNNTTTGATDTFADPLSGAIPGSNTATTDTNNATVSWSAVSGATSYRIYRGTAAAGEDHYQTTTASPFTDTGATGTAASVNAVSSAGQVGIGTATPGANLDVEGTGLFKNGTDSASAFQIQNATGTALFAADTNALKLVVGSAATDTTLVLFQLDSNSNFSSSETTAGCTTTSNQGALYYNTNTNAIRGCVNGGWEDVVTTAGLGIELFGVVPDAGGQTASTGTITSGDIAGVSNNTSSPCKVVFGSANTNVIVEPCVAYSGGRKVIVAQTTISLSSTNLAANQFNNVCLTGTGNQPALVSATSNATETSTTLQPTFSANNPVLCLAEIKASASNGQIGFIWDTRTFTSTVKEFASINSVNTNGMLVIGTTTLGTVQTTAATGAGPLRGVVVATSAAASSTTINGIIAVRGPAWVRFLSGGTATINNYVETITTTAGYGTSAAFAAGNTTNYVFGGLLQTSISTSCTTQNTPLSACQYSSLIDFQPSR
jgi:hypothetical protein